MTVEQGRTEMRMIEPKSSAIAGSCHSETAVHARPRARSTARSRRPRTLILWGLIALGAIVADTAYASHEPCVALAARAKAEAGHKVAEPHAWNKKFVAQYLQGSSTVFDVLGRGAVLAGCGLYGEQ